MFTEGRYQKKQRRFRSQSGESESETPNTEQTKPEFKTYSGGCSVHVCGDEAGCKPIGDGNSHQCVCPHDKSEPTPDLKCPRRRRTPITPKPIHDVIPPGGSNSSASVIPPAVGSTDSPSEELKDATISLYDKRLMLAAGGGALLSLLLLLYFIFWIKRRPRCPGKSKTRIRPGEPLISERYITNPQYCTEVPTPVELPEPDFTDENGEKIPLIQRNCLIFLEEIGEGCFGKVHKGIVRKNGFETVVAIKTLKGSAERSAEEDFKREVSIMSAFRHQNILSLIGVVHRDDIGGPCMVFEYMEWGDLAGVLRGVPRGRTNGVQQSEISRSMPTLSLHDLGEVALQIARGMKYLASIKFVHRDLAARNCLVGSGLVVKIADFGMSRDVYICDYYKMRGERPMPVRWMSPESIHYGTFTLESDVWAYGVVLWEIYSRGKQPFYGHNNGGAAKLILQHISLVPPAGCPTFATELMRACWKDYPSDRISFDEICSRLEAALEQRPHLPRPPATPLDSQGYLVPAYPDVPEYLAALPDPESDEDSINSEDDFNTELECV